MDHRAITGKRVFYNKAKYILLWDCIKFMNKEIRCESIYLYEYIILSILWPRSKGVNFLNSFPGHSYALASLPQRWGRKEKEEES